jgi:hypothetical protein
LDEFIGDAPPYQGTDPNENIFSKQVEDKNHKLMAKDLKFENSI